MIVIQASRPGLFARVRTQIDEDRAVVVGVGEDTVRIEWLNGTQTTKVAMTFEAAAALFLGLSKVVGYEDEP